MYNRNEIASMPHQNKRKITYCFRANNVEFSSDCRYDEQKNYKKLLSQRKREVDETSFSERRKWLYY